MSDNHFAILLLYLGILFFVVKLKYTNKLLGECFKNTILYRIMCCNWGICIERLQRGGTAV
jgi:hypothetical protein